jgi:DNA-binding XRE family transcriptional regulator
MRAREAAGLTRSQLGELVGMHYDTILRLEKGERHPNLATVCDLANALELKVIALLEG